MRKKSNVLALVIVALLSLCASSRKITPAKFAELCIKGDTQAVITAIKDGANVNAATGNDSMTPLMYAAKNGHVDTVKVLISAGADIHAKNTGGWNALMFAGNPETAATLLKAGANLNDRDNYGNNALMDILTR
ncbi:MAG: ankyrin repeat domain-containing protein [Synergistaceae bacterium]|nr:ankyrin repeat domain-containing protein [Synergistaceae bacterium]